MQPEQDFKTLRQALKLKRYEQPPPRYFNEFSSQVISRIRAGRAKGTESLLERAEMEAPWVFRLLSAFQAKPMFAGLFATAACAVLVGGVIFSEKTDIPFAGTAITAEQAPLSRNSSAAVPFATWAQKVNDANATNDAGSLFESLQPQGQIAPVMGFDSFRK